MCECVHISLTLCEVLGYSTARLVTKIIIHTNVNEAHHISSLIFYV